jgi:hypothetical protein
MPNSFDGQWDHTKPWQPSPDSVPRWSYLGPFASNAERLAQQALAPAFMTVSQIRRQIKAAPTPKRFGFSTRALGIEDIIDLGRRNPNSRASWYSGSPGGYQGTSRNALG